VHVVYQNLLFTTIWNINVEAAGVKNRIDMTIIQNRLYSSSIIIIIMQHIGLI